MHIARLRRGPPRARWFSFLDLAPRGLGAGEELGDHLGDPAGALEHPDVRGAGQDGELRGRKGGCDIAEDAAAEPAEHVDRVFQTSAVGIANEYEGGCGE